MKLFLSLVLTVCGLLGILDAGYISYSEFTGQLPTCTPPFACSTVLESPWSKIGPVPLAVFGLFFYATMFVLGILAFMDVKDIAIGKLRLHVLTIIAILGTMGLLFSIWLVFIMAVLLKAWCLYCLLSAINCSMIFILSVSLFRHGRSESQSEPLKE